MSRIARGDPGGPSHAADANVMQVRTKARAKGRSPAETPSAAPSHMLRRALGREGRMCSTSLGERYFEGLAKRAGRDG